MSAVLPFLPSTTQHLCQVLHQSQAQLQRCTRLSQGLELAVWHNAHDEVRYTQQTHHTLSVYLAGGQGSQLQGEHTARGAAGLFCVLPAQHTTHWRVVQPVQFLHLYLSDVAWAERVVRLLDAEPRSHTLAPQIYAQDAAYAAWAQTLQQLDWASDADWLHVDTLSQQMLDRLVLQAATPQRRQAVLAQQGGLSSLARRRVLAYVQAHLHDSSALRLSALAQVASLSEFHFARMFQRSMGCTVHDWVVQQRLQRAQQALRGSARGATLAQVAQDCGFSSASHLVRAFRQHLGLTPGQYAQGLSQGRASPAGS